MYKFNLFHTALIRIFTIASIVFSPAIYASGGDSGRDLKFATEDMGVPVEIVKRLTPLTKYLTSKTGIAINPAVSNDLNATIENLGSNTIQIAYLSTAAYLEAHDKYTVTPLVIPLNQGKGNFSLAIVVSNNSTSKTVSDLRGKKFALGDRRNILQPAIAASAGIKLEEFASYDYLEQDEEIAKAVLNGDFDAGIVKDKVAQQFAAQGLRVIYTSAAFPSHVIAINKNLPVITSSKIKSALLSLKNKSIMDALEPGCDGFMVVKDRDFDGIRKLINPVKTTN